MRNPQAIQSALLVMGVLFCGSALADEPCALHAHSGQAATHTPAPAPQAHDATPDSLSAKRIREMGFRLFLGRDHDGDDPLGSSVYFQARNKDRRFGVETSFDGIDEFVFWQGALLWYIKPQRLSRTFVQPYLALGGGGSISFGDYGTAFQAGGGVSLQATRRISIVADARYLTAQISDGDGLCFDFCLPTTDISFGVLLASLGVSLQFNSALEQMSRSLNQRIGYAPRRTYW